MVIVEVFGRGAILLKVVCTCHPATVFSLPGPTAQQSRPKLHLCSVVARYPITAQAPCN